MTIGETRPWPADARVTVVVVAYNHAPYVAECLDSIRAQGVPARVFVIDDCSPDGTATVVRDYVGADSDVRIVAHSVNQGLGASLAEGLELADTEFFVYIAADDWMEPARLEHQIDLMDAEGKTCGLVFSDVYRANPDGSRIGVTFAQDHADVWTLESPDPYKDLLTKNWIPAPSTMLRTAALRDVGGYDPDIFYEDHDVCLRIAAKYDIAGTAEVLASHREIPTALGRKFFQPQFRGEWLRARVLILRKQLGRRPDCDDLVFGLLRVQTIQLLRSGADDELARDTFTRLLKSPQSRFDAKLLAYWAASLPLLSTAFRRLQAARRSGSSSRTVQR